MPVGDVFRIGAAVKFVDVAGPQAQGRDDFWFYPCSEGRSDATDVKGVHPVFRRRVVVVVVVVVVRREEAEGPREEASISYRRLFSAGDGVPGRY